MKNLVQMIFCFMTIGLLVINAQAFAENNSQSLKAAVSDSVITAKVKSQFIANDTTKASTINVETNNGVVTLTGTVESEPEAATAIEIAASTVGVTEVNAHDLHIKFQPGQKEKPVRDSYITAKVKGVLIREKLMNNTDFPAGGIGVETKDSIVYLDGTVQHEDQLKKAVELAKSVEGVKKVVSKITISTSG